MGSENPLFPRVSTRTESAAKLVRLWVQKSNESVEKLGSEQILFAVTIPCRAIGIAGRNTADAGSAEPD